MRPCAPPAAAGLALLAALALGLAGPSRARAQVPGPRAAPLLDHRELKLFKREIADDRRDLERLVARLERLDALRRAPEVDVRAVDELDRKVHEEMLKEAREKRLAAHPGLGHAARGASTAPVYGKEAFRFYTEADEARVGQITLEWAALRGKRSRADLDQRHALLAELAELVRVELNDDLRSFREKGGDPAELPALPAGAEGSPPRRTGSK